MNLYAYCGNNPLNWLDPWGLCKEDQSLWKDIRDCIKEIPINPFAIPDKALQIESEEYGEYIDPFGGDYRHFIGAGIITRKWGPVMGGMLLGIDSLFSEDDPDDMKANWRGYYQSMRHPLTPLRDLGKEHLVRPPGPEKPENNKNTGDPNNSLMNMIEEKRDR
jgi:hypothetical protein